MASAHTSVGTGARGSLPARVIGELRDILGPDAVLDRYEDLLVYEYDAYMDRSLPQVVVRPTSGAQVAALITRERLLGTPGGRAPDEPGYDLVGLTVASEGTFGIVTRAWVRLLRRPPETVTFLAAYDTVEAAGAAVSALVASGVVPAALE